MGPGNIFLLSTLLRQTRSLPRKMGVKYKSWRAESTDGDAGNATNDYNRGSTRQIGALSKGMQAESRQMSIELVDASMVVVAQQFNPSVFSQLWLVRHELVAEDDFRDGCIFSDAIAQVNTKDFNLLVIPPRAQFIPKVAENAQQHLIVDKVGRLVSALPETPYRAVGINMKWKVRREGESITEMSRRIAFVPTSPVHDMFDTDDARFGAFLSKDSFGCRLKLNVKPEGEDTGDGEVLVFAFNYHRDVRPEEDATQVITGVLQQWDNARQEASTIIQTAKEN